MTRVTVGPLPSLEQLRRAFHHPLWGAARVKTMRKERGRGHAHLIFTPSMTQTSLLYLLFSSQNMHPQLHHPSPSSGSVFLFNRTPELVPNNFKIFILCICSAPVHVDNLVFSAACLAPAYPARSTQAAPRLLYQSLSLIITLFQYQGRIPLEPFPW